MFFRALPLKCAPHNIRGRAFRCIPAGAGDAAAIPNANETSQVFKNL